MKVSAVIVILVAALAGATLWGRNGAAPPGPHRQARSGSSPAPPTAVEEGDPPPAVSTPQALRPPSRLPAPLPPSPKRASVSIGKRQSPSTSSSRIQPGPGAQAPQAGGPAGGPTSIVTLVPPEPDGGKVPPAELQADRPPAGVVVTPKPPVVRPPVLLSGAGLEYPAGAIRIELDRAGLSPALRVDAAQGRVVLRILVLAGGSVSRVEIATSSGSEILDRAAAGAASRWWFAPATSDGVPIDAWVVIPVRFVVP